MLKISFSMVSLYMHEGALQTMTAADVLRPPFNTDTFKLGVIGNEPLSAVQISSLSACLTAVDGLFNTFLSLDVDAIRCLPVFNFARVAYGVVILIKMFFSAANPDSDLGKVIGKENLRVEYYINALLEKFRAAAAEDRCRPASKFLVVMAMLRSWFAKQGGVTASLPPPSSSSIQANGGHGQTGSNANGHNSNGIGYEDRPKPAGSRGSSYKGQTPHSSAANAGTTTAANSINTPLQLLSEVATGGSSAAEPARPGLDAQACTRQTAQPFFHADGISSPFATSSSAGASTAGPAPSTFSHTQPLPLFSDAAGGGAGAGNLPVWDPQNSLMDMGLGYYGLGDLSQQDFNFSNANINEGWLTDMIQGLNSPGNPFQF
jgi:RalA-binding protein 1